MKTLIVVFALVWASFANALEFSLDCATNDEKKIDVRVIKSPRRDADGKWQNRYFLEVGKRPDRFELQAGGNGDEDYSDFDVVATNVKIDIRSVSIQNKFQWASLVNTEGSSFASCRK